MEPPDDIRTRLRRALGAALKARDTGARLRGGIQVLIAALTTSLA
jgi:hypothetical protein